MQATEISYFNSHPLRSVSEWSFLGGTIYLISTRTLYGVYHNMIADSGLRLLFQLAPSTECIRNSFRQTMWADYFNSHPLRSVSTPKQVFPVPMSFQLAPSTECILYRSRTCGYSFQISTRTLYGVYQQNCLILCFQICHFLLHN